MKPSRALIAAALFALSSPVFGFGFKSQVGKLLQQQLADYEGQSPALIAAAQQNIVTDQSPKKSIVGQVLLAPIIHSYSYNIENKKGYYHIYTDFWKFTEKGSNHYEPGQAYLALHWVLEWTYGYVAEGLKARGYAFANPKGAIERNPELAKAGKKPVSVQTDKDAIRNFGSYTYNYPEFNDWTDLPFNSYTGYKNLSAVIYVHGSDRWTHLGEAQMNGEAVISYAVAHRFTVKVCTADYNCKTVTVPKDEPGNLTTRLFVPSFKSVDDAKRKENNNAAIRLASRHNADVILAAIDAAMEKAP